MTTQKDRISESYLMLLHGEFYPLVACQMGAGVLRHWRFSEQSGEYSFALGTILVADDLLRRPTSVLSLDAKTVKAIHAIAEFLHYERPFLRWDYPHDALRLNGFEVLSGYINGEFADIVEYPRLPLALDSWTRRQRAEMTNRIRGFRFEGFTIPVAGSGHDAWGLRWQHAGLVKSSDFARRVGLSLEELEVLQLGETPLPTEQWDRIIRVIADEAGWQLPHSNRETKRPRS